MPIAFYTGLSKQCHMHVGPVGHRLVYPLAQSLSSHVVFDPRFVLNAFIRHRLYEKQAWTRPQISSACPTAGSLSQVHLSTSFTSVLCCSGTVGSSVKVATSKPYFDF